MKSNIFPNFRFASILSLCLLMATVVSSQKIGYVNSTALLEGLTAMKTANNELQAVQQEYMSEGESMVKALEADYKAYMAEANSGELSQKQMAEKESILQRKRQEIMDYDTKAKVSVEAKREAIFRPILQRIDAVIQQYARDNNYDFILDSGMGHMMYKKEGEDLTEKIRVLIENP